MRNRMKSKGETSLDKVGGHGSLSTFSQQALLKHLQDAQHQVGEKSHRPCSPTELAAKLGYLREWRPLSDCGVDGGHYSRCKSGKRQVDTATRGSGEMRVRSTGKDVWAEGVLGAGEGELRLNTLSWRGRGFAGGWSHRCQRPPQALSLGHWQGFLWEAWAACHSGSAHTSPSFWSQLVSCPSLVGCI